MNDGKNESLLDPGRSAHKTDSITEGIAGIRKEISRGEAIYSESELRILDRMLDEYEQLLKVMPEG